MKLFGFKIRIPRSSMFFERRKAERVRIWANNVLSLDYQIPGEEIETGEGRDISTRGIRFACHSFLAKGTPLDLTLRFSPKYSPNKSLHMKAYVVRSYRYPRQKRYRVACAFENVTVSSHKELEDFLTWLKEQNQQYRDLYRS